MDTTIANVARVYDYMLGGKDNFRRGPGDEALIRDTISAYRRAGVDVP